MPIRVLWSVDDSRKDFADKWDYTRTNYLKSPLKHLLLFASRDRYVVATDGVSVISGKKPTLDSILACIVTRLQNNGQ